MPASSVRIIAAFALLLALASAHWIGAGPDPAPVAHHATTGHVATQVGSTGAAR